MDPSVGRDIVSLGIVQNVKLDEGRVKIYLKIPEKHRFFKHIMEDIDEKVAYIPGIKRVEKEFLD